MNKKIIFLMCLLMAMVWTAGCSCPGVRPPVVARSPRGGIRSPACPAASGYPTHAGGGTLPFEEAEATRLLLRSALADILRVNPGKKRE